MKIVDNTVIQGNLSLSDYLYLSVGVNDGTRLYGISPVANGNTNGLTVLHMGDDLSDYASGGQAFVIRFGNFTNTSVTSDIGSSYGNFHDAISFKSTAATTLTTVYNALNLNFITSAGFLKSNASGNVSIDTNVYALASAVSGFTSGSGTVDRLSKWSATQTLTDSNISDSGSLVTVLSALTVNAKTTFAVTTASSASLNIPNSSIVPSLVNGDIYATSDELKYYNKSILGIDTYVAVKAISTSNIATLSGTSATIDGQTLAVGDLVCLQAQSTASQNGVYVVASSTWARASSFTTEAQLLLRDIYVTAGTTYKGTWWMCGNKGTITVGTTSIIITQIPNGIAYGAGYAISSDKLSANAPLAYNNTTGVFTISQATTSSAGFLSAADWNTFNNKQAALTNPVTGTGTSSFIPKFTGTTTIGNSIILDNGRRIEFGTTWAGLDTTTKGIVLKEGYQITLGHNTAETYVLLDQVRSDNSQRANILTITNSAGFIPTLNIASAMTGTSGVFSSTLTATKFITSDGTASQFVKGNGDLDGNTYLTGNQTISLIGGATGSGTTSINVTLTNASVTGQLLTGLSVATNSAIAATDSILGAFQKIQAQLNNKQASGSFAPSAHTHTEITTSRIATDCYAGDDSVLWANRAVNRGNHFGRTHGLPNIPSYFNYLMLREASSTKYAVIGNAADGEWYIGHATMTNEITRLSKLWHNDNLTAANLPGGPYLPLSSGTISGNLSVTGNLNVGTDWYMWKTNPVSSTQLNFGINTSSAILSINSGGTVFGTVFVNGSLNVSTELTVSGITGVQGNNLRYYTTDGTNNDTSYAGIYPSGVTWGANTFAFLAHTTNISTFLNASSSLEFQITNGSTRSTVLQVLSNGINANKTILANQGITLSGGKLLFGGAVSMGVPNSVVQAYSVGGTNLAGAVPISLNYLNVITPASTQLYYYIPATATVGAMIEVLLFGTGGGPVGSRVYANTSGTAIISHNGSYVPFIGASSISLYFRLVWDGSYWVNCK